MVKLKAHVSTTFYSNKVLAQMLDPQNTQQNAHKWQLICE